MPQIWLTYEELGTVFHCDVAEARRAVAEHDWARRKSRDGQTRVKLPPMAAHQFMMNYAATFDSTMPAETHHLISTDSLVASLRSILVQAGHPSSLPQVSSEERSKAVGA